MHFELSLDLVTVMSVVVSISIVFVFFFQAEDGIRDLVRSRGLGDVYKRQVISLSSSSFTPTGIRTNAESFRKVTHRSGIVATPVSYTHLTLPTSDLV